MLQITEDALLAESIVVVIRKAQQCDPSGTVGVAVGAVSPGTRPRRFESRIKASTVLVNMTNRCAPGPMIESA